MTSLRWRPTFVRYKGEPILGIVATSERAALEALALVRVSYDPLPAVLDVEEALKAGAPSVNATYPKNTFEYYGKHDHQKLRFGDVEAAFKQADVVIEDRYQMSPIEHAPTETNGSITVPDTNGRYHRLHVHAGFVFLARYLGQDQCRCNRTNCISSVARSAAASAARSIPSPSRFAFLRRD